MTILQFVRSVDFCISALPQDTGHAALNREFAPLKAYSVFGSHTIGVAVGVAVRVGVGGATLDELELENELEL